MTTQPKSPNADLDRLDDESTYQRICKQECEWCRSDVYGGALYGMSFHYPGGEKGNITRSDFRDCTAPTKDAVIERQAREIEELRNLANEMGTFVKPETLSDYDGGHGSEYERWLICRRGIDAAMKEEPNGPK